MENFLILSLGDIQTRIEVDERQQYGHQDNGPHRSEISIDLERQIEPLMQQAKYIAEQMKKISPDETELSFGIKASGEGGFLGFAKAGMEAQFNVKMTWKNSAE